MDALDRKLIVLLEHDPRTTYRDIGKILHVSTPTAQRRVENLFTSARLRSIRYRIDVEALGGNWAIFHGQARRKLTPEVIEGLGEHGSINRVYQIAYSHLACWVDIHDEGDIKGVSDFLLERVELEDLKVLVPSRKSSSLGLVKFRNEVMGRPPSESVASLTETDKRIITQLSNDGRVPISSISRELGISSRTVKRRIDLMIRSRVIEPEVDWYFGIDDDIWLSMYVVLEDPMAKGTFFKRLAQFEHHLFTTCWDFSNAPGLISFDGLFRSQSEVYGLVSTVAKMDGVLESNQSVIQMSRIFDTWVHRETRGEQP